MLLIVTTGQVCRDAACLIDELPNRSGEGPFYQRLWKHIKLVLHSVNYHEGSSQQDMCLTAGVDVS